MTVVADVSELPPQPSVVTIGFFDGVHRGHQAIVGRAVEEARRSDRRPVAVTFDRHPQEVLAPGSQPRYLMSLERRVHALLGLGLDAILVQPFTLEFSRWEPQRFVAEILTQGLAAEHVIVGANFRFGHKAEGTVEDLREHGSFTVEAVDLEVEDGAPISSTRIRRLLDGPGDVTEVTAALGRPYWLDGTVIRGEGRGRTIGIPTANIEVDHRLQVPANGVYAAWAEIDVEATERWASVVNIGTRPTFGGEHVTIEAHLLDRKDHDLYGRHLALGFTHRLRDEQRFPDANALVEQIHADIAECRRLMSVDAV
ncbi:MAG: bifunctional riboflavin kinase/FAD synthetase [Actinobacteria bacterium]|nr:bifunctional riboflavin kinase/FAD synthetase [Actinomycetota bacterium]